MAKPFRRLLSKLPKEHRERIEAQKREILKEVNLRELRHALELTQEQLAETLRINQAAVSKMETQSDMFISTLRRILRAMGADLKIVATFRDGEVIIDQFTATNRPDEVTA